MAPTAITATSPHPTIMARSTSLASAASGKIPEKNISIATRSGVTKSNNFAATNTKITNNYTKKITPTAEKKKRQEATKQEKAG